MLHFRPPDEQKPFRVAFSKDHPTLYVAHAGDGTDLVPAFSKKLDAVSYLDLFSDPRGHGIAEPCPDAPIFSDCNVLFEACRARRRSTRGRCLC